MSWKNIGRYGTYIYVLESKNAVFVGWLRRVRFKKSTFWVQKGTLCGCPAPPLQKRKINPGYGPVFTIIRNHSKFNSVNVVSTRFRQCFPCRQRPWKWVSPQTDIQNLHMIRLRKIRRLMIHFGRTWVLSPKWCLICNLMLTLSWSILSDIS